LLLFYLISIYYFLFTNSMFKLSKSKSPNLAKIYHEAEDLLNAIPMIKRRRRRRRIFKFFKFFFSVCLGIFLLLAIFFGPAIFSCLGAYKQARAGKANLEEAISLAEKKSFTQAADYAGLAEENFYFSLARTDEARTRFFVSRIPILNRQLEDASYLIKTAEILSKAFKEGLLIAKNLESASSLTFSRFSREEKRKILKSIYESGPELTGLKANLDLAYLNLEKVEARGILKLFKNKIEKFKQELNHGRELAGQAIPMTEIIPALAGYPGKSNFLVLLQNSDELRPTGGFLGTYGILETDSGDITRFDTHDIYHMDMPVKDLLNVAPPESIKKYLNDKWYMRDANWSPDWPTSAQKIDWFFKKENDLLPPENQINNFSGEFNGLMAITPKLVTDLLAITGPIFIDNEEYNQNNFTRLLEYKVEKEYVQLGVPSWQRKEIIGRILEELKIKLFDLPPDRWLEALDAVVENALKKNILVYFKDDRLEDLTKDLGWAGEIKETAGDYLMIVDANLGALKTDAAMSRSISYNLEQGTNGLFVKLRINYKHNGGFDWRTTRYRTYTRIYVPLGSELVKAEGFTEGDTRVGQEAGKTYFGGFMSIEPGEIGSLNFLYKLPDKLAENIANSKQYELLIQKQPGSQVEALAVDLKLKNEVKSYSPTGFYVNDYGEGVKWETELGVDRKFEINF